MYLYIYICTYNYIYTPINKIIGHLAVAATCSDTPLQPLAATCGHSSGCKWLRFLNSNSARFATYMRYLFW